MTTQIPKGWAITTLGEVAEYALRGVEKPIGISEYELTRALPENLKSSLPSIEEIEAEMGGKNGPSNE